MKTNRTREVLIRGILLILLSLYFIVVFGQSPNLVSFDASRKAENVSLQWLLAPSNNLSTIIIERKTTDTVFQSIAEFWVNFEGNTERSFKFTDKKVKFKTPQYRLKCITADGEVQFSNTVLSQKESTRNVTHKSSAVKINRHITAGKSLVSSGSEMQPGQDNNSEHLKCLLLVQLQERENNFL